MNAVKALSGYTHTRWIRTFLHSIIPGLVIHDSADASIFIIEQAPGMHFNRGALLNVGALILDGSSYDCLVFHDVDTVCTSASPIVAYSCPAGNFPPLNHCDECID